MRVLLHKHASIDTPEMERANNTFISSRSLQGKMHPTEKQTDHYVYKYMFVYRLQTLGVALTQRAPQMNVAGGCYPGFASELYNVVGPARPWMTRSTHVVG